MDSSLVSVRQLAKALGTSAPRVLRAINDAQIPIAAGQRARLTRDEVEELRERLGETPSIVGLTRIETLVAAALGRSPLGLVSRRAVARRAGVSPTATGRAIEALRQKGLVSVQERSLPGRRAHHAVVIGADYASPAWRRVAPALTRVKPPRRSPAPGRASRVPDHLDHLFWDTADAQKEIPAAGGYVARRLLQSADPEGLAWGTENLLAADWSHAAATRGLVPEARSLAQNLAGGT